MIRAFFFCERLGGVASAGSAIASSEFAIRPSEPEKSGSEKLGMSISAIRSAATQKACWWVKSDSKARTATTSNWTLLWTIRSGRECSQKKNTPMPSTAPIRTTAIATSKTSVSPGGVMKKGRWCAAKVCRSVMTHTTRNAWSLHRDQAADNIPWSRALRHAVGTRGGLCGSAMQNPCKHDPIGVRVVPHRQTPYRLVSLTLSRTSP